MRRFAIVSPLVRAGWLLLFSVLAPCGLAATFTVDNDLVQRPDADFQSIQQALDAAATGDQIVVYPGRYEEVLSFNGKNVHLRSQAPSDWETVQATVIDAQFKSSVVTFAGSESSACILEGFTLTNGLGDKGGGVNGGALVLTRATIRYNWIHRNATLGRGGGMSSCRGTIAYNLIQDNQAAIGGGLSNCGGTIIYNTIQGNRAGEYGGGVAFIADRFERNTLEGNECDLGGGAVYRSSGAFTGNVIQGNVAGEEGGAFLLCSGPVEENTITQNQAPLGGAASRCQSAFTSNTLTKNSATHGGAMNACSGAIRGNTLRGNIATGDGGAFYACTGSVLNNTIEANVAARGGALAGCDSLVRGNAIALNRATKGGALALCGALVEGNRIEGNTAEDGGGLWGCSGAVNSNLIADNQASVRGGGAMDCRGAFNNNTFVGNTAPSGGAMNLGSGVFVRNNIFYGHTGGAIADRTAQGDVGRVYLDNNCFAAQTGPDLTLADGTVYMSIDEAPQAGPLLTRNFGGDPRFVAAGAGDYHLQPGSPCLDRASWHALAWAPAFDGDGLGRWAGEGIDLGCNEFQSSADTDGDGLTDTDEAVAGTQPAAADTDGDGLSDRMERVRDTDPLTKQTGAGLSIPADAPSVQEAILLAFTTETLMLSPGMYAENLRLMGKSLRLRSVDPAAPAVVEQTILHANRAGSAVVLAGTEGTSTTLEGLSLVYGYAASGGAIRAQGAPLNVLDCVLTSHTTTLTGTVDQADGLIEGNRLEGCQAYDGGALYRCDGVVRGNTMAANRASHDGGALYQCAGASVEGNWVLNNQAQGNGGGLNTCNTLIQGNVIQGNQAGVQGGGLYFCNRPIRDNQILGNTAYRGGGMAACNDVIEDCTIRGNQADFGGGLAYCNAEILRCRVEENVAQVDGGGLFKSYGVIDSCRFIANKAFVGGAMALCGEQVTSNTFAGNIASFGGGAVHSGYGLFEGNRIEGNRAGNTGAGFYGIEGTVRGNLFVGNVTALNQGDPYKGAGGAMARGQAEIQGNTFLKNGATLGGALYLCSGPVTLNTFFENDASQSGGAIMMTGAVIAGNLLAGNRSAGAAAMEAAGCTVVNNTLALHSEPSSCVLTAEGALVLNNIFASNAPVVLATPAPAELASNLFDGNAGGVWRDPLADTLYGEADLEALAQAHGWARDNLAGAAQFADAAGPDGDPATLEDNDYSLSPASAAIDRGTSSTQTPALDLAGAPRPLDATEAGTATLDMGAYEFLGVAMFFTPPSPPVLTLGQRMEIPWRADVRWAGTQVRFEWWRDGQQAGVLGVDGSLTGSGTLGATISRQLEPGPGYRLRMFSLSDPALSVTCPTELTLQAPSNSARGWQWLD